MRSTLLSILATAMIGLLPLSANEPTNTAPTQTPSKVIPFEFSTIQGEKIKIIERADGFEFPTLKDKNVVTMFYIYSGKPCRNQLKLFTKMKAKHSDLEFVTFELKGLTPKKLKEFENELNLKGLHMIDTQQALPFANYLAQRIKWQGSVPLLMITDKNSLVKHIQLGAMSEDEIEKILK